MQAASPSPPPPPCFPSPRENPSILFVACSLGLTRMGCNEPNLLCGPVAWHRMQWACVPTDGTWHLRICAQHVTLSAGSVPGADTSEWMERQDIVGMTIA